MKLTKTPFLLNLISAALWVQPAGAASPVRPVEAFVSPTHLFPVEGAAFLETNSVQPVQYRPLDAYDKPSGQLIGRVHLDNLHCISGHPPATCNQGLKWVLRLESGKAVALEPAEFGYETMGLVSYGKSLDAGPDTIWSPIKYETGTFWVRTAATAVHRFEELVTHVESLQEWCSAPGTCTAPSAEMSRELARMKSGQLLVAGCTSAYEVTGIVSHRGKRYYKLQLPEFDSSSPRTSLPKTGFTPMRDRTGGHTGSFSPRGC